MCSLTMRKYLATMPRGTLYYVDFAPRGSKEMKQLTQGTVQFQAEDSTLRILAAIAPDEQDSFINQAIQKFPPLAAPEANASGSPSAQIRHELERLFGASLGALD